MVEASYVEDKEELYRSVRANGDEYSYEDDGELRITYKAFQDRSKEPSVDRAWLRGFQPEKSKLSDGDGITSLITCEVRSIVDVETKVVTKIKKTVNTKTTKHSVDVIHDPVDDDSKIDQKANPAHSKIAVDPEYIGGKDKQEKTFKKLKLALARLATLRGWKLEPNQS